MSMNQSWLLRLYPATWRERYGDEFEALLEQCRPSPMILFDVIRGALDARLRLSAGTGRMPAMLDRLRSSEIAVFWAFVAFVVAGLGFQKMSEDAAKAGVMQTYPAVGAAFHVVVAGAVFALVAVLAGGLPLALAALNYARSHRRWDIPLLLAVPALALAGWVGYMILLTGVLLRGTSHTNFGEPGGMAVLFSVIGLFVLVAAVSAAAVSLAIARSEIDERLYRFAFWPAAVATAAMAAVSIAVVAWGLGLAATAPRFFGVDGGPMVSYGTFTWLRVVVVMGLASVVAAASVLRGVRARVRAYAA